MHPYRLRVCTYVRFLGIYKDANNISDSIIDIITKFNLKKTIVGFTCDGGANLKKCSDIICYQFDRTYVFTPKKTIFEMDCLAHLVSGACKASVVGVLSEDESLDTSINTAKINKAITWTNKSQKGAVARIQAQKHCKLANVLLLSPAKTCFAKILNSFKILLMNKDAI